MFEKRVSFWFLVLVSVLVFSCSKYQRVLKSTDLNLKYDMAMKYYEEKDYLKAYPLFEELTVIYRGTSKAEMLNYYFAYCEYFLKDYVIATHRFKSFSTTFPTSSFAEECHFMSAYCYYLNSPKPSLDQTNTYKAIREIQLFVNKYQKSTLIDSCNTLLDVLRNKLETKAFNISRQYYHMREYKAAIISFNNTLQDFPDTKYAEEITYLILKSNYLLAINSIESKKEERLEDTIKAYYTFVDEYENSSHLKETQTIFDQTLKHKEKLLKSKRKET